MIHQNNYKFLEKESGPKVIVEAVKLYGTKEIVGKQHSKEILSWAEDLELKNSYTNDEIPWCGLFVAIVVKRAGFDVVHNPLWARNWNNFGTKQSIAMLGDILTFTRPGGGGHVGFYIGEDDTCYHVLGGNQANMVNTTRILKSRCIGIRRCDWKIAQPKNVRVIKLSSTGQISENES
ncbi:TIGR02594 family protein [Flavobacterium sp.]|uniref:TIGR02594 family protein n=1 Tax=Flavobacterium sp. TaxID=239 RepID=UPI0025BEE22D|nr:TIGR02594 family protein [Flavobacterium sp.]MBA4154144.1 TIGR02594 family protein [Flavobacterium sp.]